MPALQHVLDLLIAGDDLPEECRDHGLNGNWRGFRDAHIAPDWILVYRITDTELQLARLGSHALVFG
ncbi:MAG: type II toxin-antitoxin system YafQ family toxin [Guyparkeria sp.]